MAPPASLLDEASAPYRTAGRFAYHFSRGKLRRDPAFSAILEQGLLTESRQILDLGCGQGLLAAWLLAAVNCSERGAWPEAWPSAPRPESILGIDRMSRDIERARRALGDRAAFQVGDIRETAFGSADAIVILDVLHFMDHEAQQSVLTRVHAALAPKGVLLLRIGNAAAGLRFGISKWVDQSVAFARSGEFTPLYCRSLGEWLELLASRGFACTPIPMSTGTPFSNVLLVARPT